MHKGTNQRLTLGSTEFSAHLASEDHEKYDVEAKLLCTEEDWFKRGVKEAIAIRKVSTPNRVGMEVRFWKISSN